MAAKKKVAATKAKPAESKKEAPATRSSNPEVVDAYMKKLKHPMKETAEALREMILSVDKTIGEEIAWNAPSFFYTGKMKPFNAKEYKRFILVFNFLKKDCLRVIFLKGANANDRSGMLEGDYADGRRLAYFYSVDDVNEKKKELQKIVKTLLKQIADAEK
jgi:hypothetical protein